MTKRTEIRFFPTDEMSDYIDQLSTSTGLTKTDVIRSVLFNYQTGDKHMPYPLDKDAYDQVAKALREAGSNFNQAMALANTLTKSGRADSNTVAHLQAAIVDFNTNMVQLLRGLRDK